MKREYIYIYMYIYIYIYTYMCVYIYIYTYIHSTCSRIVFKFAQAHFEQCVDSTYVKYRNATSNYRREAISLQDTILAGYEYHELNMLEHIGRKGQ